jgi:hypothetical protein
MGFNCLGLFCHPWLSGARSGTMMCPLATSCVTPGALGFSHVCRGDLCIYFHLGKKLGESSPKYTTVRWTFGATCGPLATFDAMCPLATSCGMPGVLGFSPCLPGGGSYAFIFALVKVRGIFPKIHKNQIGF